MKVALGVALSLVAAVTGRGQSAVELKVGDQAPNFSLRGSDGKTHTLAEYRGKSAVVLAWFPKAFTGG
jgi:peroxiredoxin Q/BCP